MKITDKYLMETLAIDEKTLKRFKEIRKEGEKFASGYFQPKKQVSVLGISGSARDEFDMAGESSNSEFLLTEAFKFFDEKKIKNEIIKLRNFEIKPCKACYSSTNAHCHFPCSCFPKGSEIADDMSNILYQKVLDADIIFFATPVNNFKMSSHMSLFIDRLISLDGSVSPADPKASKDLKLNKKHTEYIGLTGGDSNIGSGFIKRFAGKIAGIIVTGHEEGASMVISSLFMTLNHYGMIFPPWSTMYAMGNVERPTHEDKDKTRGNFFVSEARNISENLLTMAEVLKKKNKNIWKIESTIN